MKVTSNTFRKVGSIIAMLPLLLFCISPTVQAVLNVFFFRNGEKTHADYYWFYQQHIMVIEVLGCICIAALLITFLRNNKGNPYDLKLLMKRAVPFLLLSLLAVCMIISSLVNGMSGSAVYGDMYRFESLNTFLIYIFVFFWCGMLLCEEKYRLIVFRACLAGSVALGIMALIWKFVYQFKWFYGIGLSAVFHQFNHYAYYLLVCLSLAGALYISERRRGLKIFYLVAFLINTIVLILNDTFGCQLAAICVLVFQVILKWKSGKEYRRDAIMILVLYFAITIAVSFAYTGVLRNFTQFFADIGKVTSDSESAGSAGTGRWTLWTHTVQYISEKPIWGWGVEGISERLDMETHGVNTRSHCEFLTYAAFFGIPAALLYISACAYVVIDRLRKLSTTRPGAYAALIAGCAYLASSVFGNTMYYTTPFVYLLLGITFSESFGEEG